jgi:SPX domain protein involved in polyphosphate accumulation
MNQFDYRYERKLIDKSGDIEKVISNISMMPDGFKKVFPDRHINNIYFDDHKFSLYSKNYNGLYNRIKYRIRWYGSLKKEIINPILELKIKKGSLGYKILFKLKTFDLNKIYSPNLLLKIIKNSDIPKNVKEKIISLRPVLFNRYNRRYYKSIVFPDYRITVDDKLIYSRPKNITISKLRDENPIIVEIKYNKNNDNLLSDHFSKKIGHRVSKFSKYVNGIIKLYY